MIVGFKSAVVALTTPERFLKCWAILLMVETVVHEARKFGGHRTKALCLRTIGSQVSSRNVTPCPGVTPHPCL